MDKNLHTLSLRPTNGRDVYQPCAATAEILRQVIPTAFASFYLGELVLQ
jgi:hypothetical protein